MATMATLLIVDDLVSGPMFWLLAQFNRWGAVAIAFLVYWLGQVSVVRSLTSEKPGRWASFILRRLQPRRKSEQIERNERTIRNAVASTALALPLSLVIGGVLPPMILYSIGYTHVRVRRISLVTAAIYAIEFAFLHAYLPGTLGSA